MEYITKQNNWTLKKYSCTSEETCLCVTAVRSLTSPRSNQIWGDALARALCKIPRKPSCLCPILIKIRNKNQQEIYDKMMTKFYRVPQKKMLVQKKLGEDREINVNTYG